VSNRSDIPGRLIYTCKCGWVDKGHARSHKVARSFVSADALWDEVKRETGPISKKPGETGFKVSYRQDMGRSIFGHIITTGVTNSYLVQKGLTRHQKESVALAIFMEVSMDFESYQGLFSLATDSSFSVEDLVSDLIGFYTAVRPGKDYLKLCKPVSTAASLKVWDTYGPVGSTKNKTFRPKFFHCDECRHAPPRFPHELLAIKPEKKGKLFRDWTGEDEMGPVSGVPPGYKPGTPMW
jgi:hypothetical protein